MACASSLSVVVKGRNQPHLFFVGLRKIAGQHAFTPVVVLLQCLVITTECAPAAARGGEPGLMPVALLTQGQLLGREMFKAGAHRCAAGTEQRDLMRLQVTECAPDHLFSRELMSLVRRQQQV